MKVALFTHSNYNKGNYNKTYMNRPAFCGAREAMPVVIKDTFKYLRTEVPKIPEMSVPGKVAKEVISNADEVATVVVEKKRKNWFFSFFFNNPKEGKKVDMTYSKGDKNAIESLLRDTKTQKALFDFLNDNGIKFGSI